MANGILKVGDIQTSSGSGTINIGQSGETVNFPTGVTVSGLTNTPAFLASKTSNQAVSSAATTKVTFDNEVYDVGSSFDSNKFTVPSGKGGTYNLYYSININAGAVSVVQWILAGFYKNGSEHISLGGTDFRNNYGGYTSIVTRNVSLVLNAGDYIEVFVSQAQTSGTPSVLGTSSPLSSYFGGYKLIT